MRLHLGMGFGSSNVAAMGGGGSGSADQWSPTTNVTLTNGGKTATSTAGGNIIDLSNASRTGTRYMEITIVAGGGGFGNVGIAQDASDAFLGAGSSIGYRLNGPVKSGNSTVFTGSSCPNGTVVGILVKNGKVYFRNNGTWQNSADPIAESGGVAHALSPIYVACGPNASGDSFTANFGASPFANAMPAGTTSWDGSQSA